MRGEHTGLHDEWLDGTVGPRFGGGPIDLKPITAALEPGESVLWVGRPSPEVVFRRSLPGAFLGLLALGFALFWAVEVIRGGSNNWDRGKAVPPFAAHNVKIAVGVVLWFGIVGLPMMTFPLWAHRKARGTSYVLTDCRALILESGPRATYRVSGYPPGKLATIRLSERSDGSGDLVFEERKGWNNMKKAVGFLGVVTCAWLRA